MTGGTSTVICDCNGPHTRGRSLIWMYVWCAAMSQRTYFTRSPNISVRNDSVSSSNGVLSIIIPSARCVLQIRSRIRSGHVLFELGWNRATTYGALLFVDNPILFGDRGLIHCLHIRIWLHLGEFPTILFISCCG